MRVIIPAAGMGSRLFPLTQFCPKGLLDVGGKPLLAHMLERLYEAKIDEVICVSGHCGHLLEEVLTNLERRPPLQFVHNPDYQTSNSIVSLALTRKWWDEEFCIIDSDVGFRPPLLQRLITSSNDCMVIDNTRAFEQIDMKVELDNGRIWYMDKNLVAERTTGEFFGLSHWTTVGAEHLSNAIDQLLSSGYSDVWYQFAIRDAAKSIAIAPLYTDSSQWVEVDTPEDLHLAERFFNMG